MRSLSNISCKLLSRWVSNAKVGFNVLIMQSKQTTPVPFASTTPFVPKTILWTNMSTCHTCDHRHSSIAASVQHLANSGCDGSTLCYCSTKITKANASDHILVCRFFAPIGCTLCPERLFKTLERANNHAWSAHGSGRHTFELQPTVKFKLSAQAGTRFAHMQFSQVLERTRNNTQKRAILKSLIKESNFTATNSYLFRLSAENKHRTDRKSVV